MVSGWRPFVRVTGVLAYKIVFMCFSDTSLHLKDMKSLDIIRALPNAGTASSSWLS
jgi:hypothetical protein